MFQIINIKNLRMSALQGGRENGWYGELFVSIYHFLHEMKENKCKPHFNNETLAKADSLFNLVTDYISFVSYYHSSYD